MRWPWSRDEPRAKSEATEAREKADDDLADAKALWPEVRRVSKSLRELREKNHFGASVAVLFRNEGRDR